MKQSVKSAETRRKILKIYAYILAVGVPYLVFVTLSGIKIPCIFKLSTGLDCPGCGVTRMFVSMAEFDFKSAFFFNPAAFVLFFAWNAIALFAFHGRITLFYSRKFLLSAMYVSIFVLIVYGILRNIAIF